MAINWSNIGEKIPGVATAVEEGLLRQRELGGVMYTAAAQKEAARVAGATKQMESQQEALMERAKIESRYLEDINKEMATNPPVWDPEEKRYTEGAELFEQSLRAQERAAEAWRQVYESRGMKYPKTAKMDWTVVAENVAKSFEGAEFKDLQDALKKDRKDKGAKTSIKERVDRSLLTLSPKQKSELEDEIIDAILAIEIEAEEVIEGEQRGLGLGMGGAVMDVLQKVPWGTIGRYVPHKMGGIPRPEGVITRAEQADETVSYAPEIVDQRYKGEGTDPLAGKRIRTLNEIMGD